MVAAEKIGSEVCDQLWWASFEKLGYGKLKIVSGSMAPLINIGDRVEVNPVEDPESVRLGDLILFETKGGYLVHRIVGKLNLDGRLHFRQKGDAAVISNTIPADQVVGKVAVIEKPDRIVHLDGFVGRGTNLVLAVHLMVIERLYRTARRIGKCIFSDTSGVLPQAIAEFVHGVLGSMQGVLLRLILRTRRGHPKRLELRES